MLRAHYICVDTTVTRMNMAAVNGSGNSTITISGKNVGMPQDGRCPPLATIGRAHDDTAEGASHKVGQYHVYRYILEVNVDRRVPVVLILIATTALLADSESK